MQFSQQEYLTTFNINPHFKVPPLPYAPYNTKMNIQISWTNFQIILNHVIHHFSNKVAIIVAVTFVFVQKTSFLWAVIKGVCVWRKTMIIFQTLGWQYHWNDGCKMYLQIICRFYCAVKHIKRIAFSAEF